MIAVLARTYGKALLTDGRKTQSLQSTGSAGRPRFSLAVPLSMPMSAGNRTLQITRLPENWYKGHDLLNFAGPAVTAKAQRAALIAAIRRNSPDAQVECSDLSWLRVPETARMNGPLRQIFAALTNHRGYSGFATAGRRLVCDIVIPSKRLIVEYDERQHFTAPRAIALKLYPKDTAICFDRAEWIAHCNAIVATDNDPPYRDEQRAFYDSVRDLLASANGYRVARLKHGTLDWQTCDADKELSTLFSMRPFQHSSPSRSSPRLATVCVEGQPARQYRSHQRRLELLAKLVKQIDERWEKLDAVVFPGGFLRLDASIGHLCYADRVQALDAAGFVTLIKNAVRALRHSPGVLITLGVDGPNFPNGDGGDQLCVAADTRGIVGIGRKIFPVAGDEAGALLCYDTDFGEGRRVVKLASGRKAVLSACYDMFGVAERGDVDGARARNIRWIGTYQDQIERGSRGFDGRLTTNLGAFGKVLDGVTVGIAAIHYFEGHSTGFWQRHGIAACSAALGSGFAVGAAHFGQLPLKPNSSALAAAQVPVKHVTQGIQRHANSWVPNDHFEFRCPEGAALVRLFSL